MDLRSDLRCDGLSKRKARREHFAALGVIGHPLHRGPGEEEMGVAKRTDARRAANPWPTG